MRRFHHCCYSTFPNKKRERRPCATEFNKDQNHTTKTDAKCKQCSALLHHHYSLEVPTYRRPYLLLGIARFWGLGLVLVVCCDLSGKSDAQEQGEELEAQPTQAIVPGSMQGGDRLGAGATGGRRSARRVPAKQGLIWAGARGAPPGTGMEDSCCPTTRISAQLGEKTRTKPCYRETNHFISLFFSSFLVYCLEPVPLFGVCLFPLSRPDTHHSSCTLTYLSPPSHLRALCQKPLIVHALAPYLAASSPPIPPSPSPNAPLRTPPLPPSPPSLPPSPHYAVFKSI